ncbi:hypothetical protein Ahy_B02g059008 [Arachis hypogaea]|uniref:Aminotransferase-like plant mobile domain-containing protein n=1 Tax=Arachis hypogaea TaxID=3818 RepID=A0A445AFW3_ARAHY|nr:hypothetical protein Ahy_B02g059008 [Arachis hypogaea]
MARADNHDGDINRLYATWHITGTTDFEYRYVAILRRSRLLLSRRVSHTISPPDTIVPYLREDGFSDALPLRDFVFDNSLITVYVERWRPETHTFYLLLDECTITLQDVAYHLGLR